MIYKAFCERQPWGRRFINKPVTRDPHITIKVYSVEPVCQGISYQEYNIYCLYRDYEFSSQRDIYLNRYFSLVSVQPFQNSISTSVSNIYSVVVEIYFDRSYPNLDR